MTGRKKEQAVLNDCLNSPQAEFLAVYGRRRVGKTFLIHEFFQGQFAFHTTGVSGLNTRKALRLFHRALQDYGEDNRTLPKDWFEAFDRLKVILRAPSVTRYYLSGKRVVFLDELPWMNTARSDFMSALEYFWNNWGSAQKDLLLIVCGSASSWMLRHLVWNTGGLYHRVTCQIHLKPFCLQECEEMLRGTAIPFTRRQIVETYMVFGGIPYYLNYLKPQYSLGENVQQLLFDENGPLRCEFEAVFSSLFRNADSYVAVIEALCTRKSGMTRSELLLQKGVPEGKELTQCLNDLDDCGFIRKYTDFTTRNSRHVYQLIDPQILFFLTWVRGREDTSWLSVPGTPAYDSWSGHAFEIVCLQHLPQIRQTLGISGVSCQVFCWRSRNTKPGVQVDLLIDRRDDVINLCEIKYVEGKFSVDAAFERDLLHKVESFRQETGTKKAIQLTMITREGLVPNEHRNAVVWELTADDLFREIPSLFS